MSEESVNVTMFGKDVKAVRRNGCVMFERKSFVKAIGVTRAKRIADSMEETFGFLGEEGIDSIVSSGNEHMLCNLALIDPDASEELKEYAGAWLLAYEMLCPVSKGGE